MPSIPKLVSCLLPSRLLSPVGAPWCKGISCYLLDLLSFIVYFCANTVGTILKRNGRQQTKYPDSYINVMRITQLLCMPHVWSTFCFWPGSLTSLCSFKIYAIARIQGSTAVPMTSRMSLMVSQSYHRKRFVSLFPLLEQQQSILEGLSCRVNMLLLKSKNFASCLCLWQPCS